MRVIYAGVLVALTACAGELEDPDRFTQPLGPDAAVGGGGGECVDIEQELFATSCAGSICHDADAPAGGLDLVSADVASRLLDVASTCEDRLLIDTADVDASFLLNKLGDAPACGDRMPLGQTAMTPEEIDCVRDWIVEVAP